MAYIITGVVGGFVFGKYAHASAITTEEKEKAYKTAGYPVQPQYQTPMMLNPWNNYMAQSAQQQWGSLTNQPQWQSGLQQRPTHQIAQQAQQAPQQPGMQQQQQQKVSGAPTES